jgi:hypothetical protein
VREEHRIITALFADLAGSTALGERLSSWFTEGYETPDLQAARQLLDDLS